VPTTDPSGGAGTAAASRNSVAVEAASRPQRPVSSRCIAPVRELAENAAMAAVIRPTEPAPAAPHPARAAFGRILNLRSVAAVFYFCLVVVVGKTLHDLQTEEFGSWAMAVIRFLRQYLISGLLLLATIAVIEAIAVAAGLRRRAAIALALPLILAASAAAMALRIWVYGSWGSASLGSPYNIGVTLTWTFLAALAYVLLYLTREEEQQRQMLVEAECSQQQLGAQMLRARLSALQAQIEPHFLFNTLANVRRLYETTPSRGREMLASLIDYLRAALPSMRSDNSTLGRELDLARSFLTVLQMRMGERLQFSIHADAELLEAAVPPMILPTLVENAIKHGLGPLPEGGRIELRARRAGDDMVIEVRDTGAGFTAAGGSGVGLANTRSRLAGLYGSRASLQLAAVAPRGVVATLRLPLQTVEAVPACA
jgi:sensor histidine kinase YesM